LNSISNDDIVENKEIEKTNIFDINFISCFSCLISGIDFKKIQKFFLLCGLNFYSETTFYSYEKRLLDKNKVVGLANKSCIDMQEFYVYKILILIEKVIKKLFPNIGESFVIPFEIIYEIYTFKFDCWKFDGAFDGRFNLKKKF
jgi:hypothetical protein